MVKLWKYLRAFALVGWRIVFDYFRYFLPMSRHPERYDIHTRYNAVRSTIIFVLKRLKLDVRMERSTARRDKPILYISNHVSALDPLLLIAQSDEPLSFIAKKEARKIVIAGRVIRALDGLFLDRADPFQAVRCFQIMKKKIAEGWSYCVYPEGTREKGEMLGHLLPFHPGSFKIGYMAKCDIVLVATYGSFHAFSNEIGNRSNLVQVKEVETLSYENYKDIKTTILASYCEEKLSTPLLAMVQNDRAYVRSGQNKTRPPRWWKETKKGEMR